MKLISMTDFVLEKDITEIKQRDSIVKYAHFLSQPLNLSMFIPCKLVDGVWVVLEEPGLIPSKELQEFRESKGRVLFEGFEISEDCEVENEFIVKNKNEFIVAYNVIKGFKFYFDSIEDLIKYNLELTPTAKKQIGL